MLTGIYVGPQMSLRGERALLQDNVGLGDYSAQFNRHPGRDPACLQKGGPEPEPGDLRFGWHIFPKTYFKLEEK